MKIIAYVILAREEGENFGVIGVVFEKEKALEIVKNSVKVLVEDSWDSEKHDLNEYYKSLEDYSEVYIPGVGEVQIIERETKIPKEIFIAGKILE